MSMPLEKAKLVLKAYKQHNFNAMKALPSVGYSKETADSQSSRTIDTAVRTLVRSGDHKAIYDFVGVAESDVAKEYREIIKQNKNYPAKLRALEPLLKLHGIQWEDQKVQVTPTLNIGVIERKQPSRAVESVAQSILCDIDCTAQHSHTIERRAVSTSPRPDSSINDEKERDSQLQNFSEKVTIDKNEEVSQNIEKEGELKVYETFLEPVGSEDEVDFIESLKEENE